MLVRLHFDTTPPHAEVAEVDDYDVRSPTWALTNQSPAAVATLPHLKSLTRYTASYFPLIQSEFYLRVPVRIYGVQSNNLSSQFHLTLMIA